MESELNKQNAQLDVIAKVMSHGEDALVLSVLGDQVEVWLHG